jgi:YbbR domain-containing protein
LGLKAVALIASIGLFIIVRGPDDTHPQAVVHFQVEVLLPPTNASKMLVSEIPEEVRVTVQGSTVVLNAVRSSERRTPVQMDLRDPVHTTRQAPYHERYCPFPSEASP